VARSRSLFLWEKKSPMRFYVRPGLKKLRLAPLVLAGGKKMCRVQEPGAVLQKKPGEAAPGGAVSKKYVTECVERNRRKKMEPFRLPPAPPEKKPRGRLAFTEAEKKELLRAVRGRGEKKTSGRALWKELEKKNLTRHSWQAMREKKLRHLRPLLGEPKKTAEPAQSTGLFEKNNREFESTESKKDASDVSEELLTKKREEKSLGETASEKKTGPEDSALPDTKKQREERPTSTCSKKSVVGEVVKTMQQKKEKFSMDLFTVTKKFLKNTGEVETTKKILQTGQRLDGYQKKSREDDLQLQKEKKCVRNKLIAKFGAENVAKRVAFRKS
ncbi:TE2IP protein, partial [Corythaeola cristata]|nr:TE2IP protein [Corythaeola cristata]